MSSEIAVVDDNSTTPTISQFDIVDVEAVSGYMDNYQELVEALLEESDYQMIGNKKAKKKSAWRKLATAFRITDEVIDEDLTFDETNQIVTAKYTVRATLPNGRSTIGVGVCSIYDKIRYKATGKFSADTETPSNFELRGRFSHAEHDVPSTAHTRAKNRAIADLIGAGEVSAEELSDFEEPKKVSRSPKKKSGDVQPEEPAPKTNGRKRRNRKAKQEVVEAEVIETKGEEVEETPSANPFEEAAEKNKALHKALARIKEANEEVTAQGIIDELYTLYDLGDITMDEYYAAKELITS